MELVFADCSGSTRHEELVRMLEIAKRRGSYFSTFGTAMRLPPIQVSQLRITDIGDNGGSVIGGTDINNSLLTLDAACDLSMFDVVFVVSDLMCDPPKVSIKPLLEKTCVYYVSIAATLQEESEQLEFFKRHTSNSDKSVQSRIGGFLKFSDFAQTGSAT